MLVDFFKERRSTKDLIVKTYEATCHTDTYYCLQLQPLLFLKLILIMGLLDINLEYLLLLETSIFIVLVN